jgi:hypothetical protein
LVLTQEANVDNRNSSPGHLPGHATHPQALQACIDQALAEAPGLAVRWVAGLLDVLKQQEAWAPQPRDRVNLAHAIKVLIQQKNQFETEWVVHWSRCISDALHRRGDGAVARRSLANITFDELELMDDIQVQATVQVARLEQAVQGAAGDSLTDLSALLSAAQGFASVKPEHNPLRPDVAIAALRQTMESLTPDRAARTLWLQQGTPILGQELQVLYRHLIRVLGSHGVTPVGFNVVQAPLGGSAPVKPGGAYVRQRPEGVADDRPKSASLPPPWPPRPAQKGAPPDLLTLDHLHQLLATGPQETHGAVRSPSPAAQPPVSAAAGADPWTTIVPRAMPKVGTPHGGKTGVPPPVAGTPGRSAAAPPNTVGDPNPDKSRPPEAGAAPPSEAADHLTALASEVVQLMLDGMLRDTRLLPPVRDMLRQLQPALLRIAHEDPRFFADKLNPARRLLDEITQRSLAFENVGSKGLTRFLATLDDVAQLFLRADVNVSTLFETALEVLTPEDPPRSEGAERDQARGRAVATLVRAEQRFMLADKVAQELMTRPDFAKADPRVQQFVCGPWAQVIAQARLEPVGDLSPERLSPDLRYMGVLSDLLWSSRVSKASRNRVRLARLIPGLLRTLREGLQTIDYDAAASREFFSTIMVLHEAGLKGEADTGNTATGGRLVASPPEETAGSFPASAPPPAQPWMGPSETADTGFMSEPFLEPAQDDFADTQPQFDADPASPVGPGAAKLEAGAWVSLQNDDGAPAQRLQLTWSSPHGTMYLFNGPNGQTVSMTRRSFDKLSLAGRLTLVAAHSVVDDALDGVVDVAVLNSTRVPPPPDEATVYPDLLPPLN